MKKHLVLNIIELINRIINFKYIQIFGGHEI